MSVFCPLFSACTLTYVGQLLKAALPVCCERHVKCVLLATIFLYTLLSPASSLGAPSWSTEGCKRSSRASAISRDRELENPLCFLSPHRARKRNWDLDLKLGLFWEGGRKGTERHPVIERMGMRTREGSAEHRDNVGTEARTGEREERAVSEVRASSGRWASFLPAGVR